jgi:hypothetical protein
MMRTSDEASGRGIRVTHVTLDTYQFRAGRVSCEKFLIFVLACAWGQKACEPFLTLSLVRVRA